jgi:hypothetical protein
MCYLNVGVSVTVRNSAFILTAVSMRYRLGLIVTPYEYSFGSVLKCYVPEVVLVFMVNGQIGRLRTGVRMERRVVLYRSSVCLQNIKPRKMLQYFVMCMSEIINGVAIRCMP